MHTYVVVEVSARPYAEISKKMVQSGYWHVFDRDDEVIDMHGIPVHPDLLVDAEGKGHIVFSPNQARTLAKILLKHADAAEGR